MRVSQDAAEALGEGSKRVEAASKSGEQLYVTTSTDGRESIRRDLRELHDRCDAHRDAVALVKWRLEQQVSAWRAFEKSLDVFDLWLVETEEQLSSANTLQATLAEKESKVQTCKALQRDVSAHAAVLESARKSAEELRGGAEETVAKLTSRYSKTAADVDVRFQSIVNYNFHVIFIT